jgi:hypothetical protein
MILNSLSHAAFAEQRKAKASRAMALQKHEPRQLARRDGNPDFGPQELECGRDTGRVNLVNFVNFVRIVDQG